MKTEFKYIYFNEISYVGRTRRFQCINKKHGSLLGMVGWWSPWRQYCFSANDHIVLSAGCLKDITSFIEELMAERKKKC